MQQIAQPVWNRIARSQSLRTKWAKVMFNLDQDECLRVLESVGSLLESQGHPAKVILAYLTVLPLLVENRAIQEFVRLNPQFRAALPEVNSQTEAVILMSLDLMLSRKEANQLLTLLPETLNQIPMLWKEPMIASLAA